MRREPVRRAGAAAVAPGADEPCLRRVVRALLPLRRRAAGGHRGGAPVGHRPPPGAVPRHRRPTVLRRPRRARRVQPGGVVRRVQPRRHPRARPGVSVPAAARGPRGARRVPGRRGRGHTRVPGAAPSAAVLVQTSTMASTNMPMEPCSTTRSPAKTTHVATASGALLGDGSRNAMMPSMPRRITLADACGVLAPTYHYTRHSMQRMLW